MQIKGDQLAAHLQRGLASLYVITGDEPLLVIEAADAIRVAARAGGFTERETLVAAGQGFNWGLLAAASGSMSLFGDKTLIDLRIPTGKPGREGSQALQDHCQRLSPDALTLVTLPALDWKDEKGAWFSALDKAGTVVRANAPALAELPVWIGARFARQKQRPARDALQFLAERVEGNLLAAHQEIQKLGLLYPEGDLSLEQVRDAVTNVARYDVFKLGDALLAGDPARLTRMLDGLRAEGEAPPLVLWALAEETRTLLRLKTGEASGKPLDALFKENRVWGAKQGLVRKALQRLDVRRLSEALRECATLDQMAKGLAKGDFWNESLRLGLKLAS